jgi:class 3 adenylate cyclase/tetratricopeptide (TPR) repeat protein
MRCSKCGRENRAGRRFCAQCGGGLTLVCSSCQAENEPGEQFCGDCGQRIAEPAKAPPRPEPRSYTPKHLADKILQSKSALEGERKQVTVLFADVKGSMDLSESIDPEDWHRIMERFFTILTDGVHRFEGTVNQYMGDGIMALFGAPIAHEDHAARASYAALALQDDLRRYANELRVERGVSFSVRMGLNSGEVVVGKIGDDLRMDYTALGHTASLGARMEQIAEPGKTYLTEHTARLVEGMFALHDFGKLPVKGVKEPVRVYELQGLGRLRTRLEVSRARGFSKFVGRQSEMAVLEMALEQAISGNAQVVGIVAEPGVGKSRLCHEFLERCRARGLQTFETHGVPYRKATPFLPMLEFMRSFFGITDQDNPQAARQKIAGGLLLLDESFREALPLIFDFLGVPDPEQPTARMDPEARQRQLYTMVKRITQIRGRRVPAVTLFEDLHWFDGGSDALLEQLVEALPGTQYLRVVNFRPEYQARWMQKSYYQRLALLPLNPEAIAELLTDLLGNDPSLAGLGGVIRERTGGNPFFIEEIVLSLAEAGSLEGSKGAYRLTKPIHAVSIPPTVQAVLAARIDRLPEKEKRVLQTASVIGKTFSESVLRRVGEFPETELAEALRALIEAEYFYEEALYPEAEFSFKHPLTQEVAYRSQLAERRARVHAAVARAIEEVDSAKLGECAALLAYHWEHAGHAREAAKWHRRAAEWVGLNNPVEALRHWGSVKELLDTLPEAPENLNERAAVRAQIMLLLARMGDVDDQAASLFREGRELATRSGDPHVVSQLLNSIGQFRLFSGGVVEALDPLLEAIRRADETGDLGLRVAVRYGFFAAYFNAGRLRECVAIAEEGLRLAQGDLNLGVERIGFSPSLGLSAFRGGALCLMGHPREGAVELDRVLELEGTRQQLMLPWFPHALHVFRCEVTGEAAVALAHGRKAVDYAEQTGSHVGRIFAYFGLGVANVLNLACHDALEVLEQAMAIGRARRLLFLEGGVLAATSAAHLALGDRAKALALAEEAIALCRRLGVRRWEFSAQLIRMRALREIHGLQATREIEAALGEAEAWLEMSGAKSYEPFLHVERAELARLTGDEVARERELREAHRLFTEIGAPIRAAEVARELGL